MTTILLLHAKRQTGDLLHGIPYHGNEHSRVVHTMSTTVVDSADSHRHRRLRFLRVYEPIIFVLYFAKTPDSASQYGFRIFWYKTICRRQRHVQAQLL
jgi:hypothetical protein